MAAHKPTLQKKFFLLLTCVLVLSVFLFLVSAQPPSDEREPLSYYKVTVTYPVPAAVAEWIQKHTVVEGFLGPSTYILGLAQNAADDMKSLPFVVDVSPYASGHHFLSATAEKDVVEVIVRLFDPADTYRVVDEMMRKGFEIDDIDYSVLDEEGNIVVNQLKLTTTGSRLSEISAVEGVEWIDEVLQYTAENEVGTVLTGARDEGETYGLTGNNQLITVTDTGLDSGVDDPTMHPDMQGRIFGFKLYAGTSPDDLQGHGTHVTGIALGNGMLSGSNPAANSFRGSYAGAAPKARVYFQAIGSDNPDDPYVYPPGESVGLQDSKNQGVRIHTHSYGTTNTAVFGTYTGVTADIDRHIWFNKDYLAVYGAGNYGFTYGNGSMDPNAVAKNVIAAGGSENYKPTLADPPIIADDPDDIYIGTSLGPTEDGRIKPDLMSPATSIFSTRTRYSPSTTGLSCRQNQTNVVTLGPNYSVCSGTSMSAPHIAGLAAMLREYYITQKGLTPSAALLKATLIAGAQEMKYGYPSMTTGWGRVNLTNSLPHGLKKVYFLDRTVGMSTGNTYNITILKVGATAPFKAVLVWTDYPGTPGAGTMLVNDLDFTVTDPQGTVYYGNDFSAPYNTAYDRKNNIEVVKIDAPASGTYNLQINAQNVPSPTQPFAVVVTYDEFEPQGKGTNTVGTVRNCTYVFGTGQLTC